MFPKHCSLCCQCIVWPSSSYQRRWKQPWDSELIESEFDPQNPYRLELALGTLWTVKETTTQESTSGLHEYRRVRLPCWRLHLTNNERCVRWLQSERWRNDRRCWYKVDQVLTERTTISIRN